MSPGTVARMSQRVTLSGVGSEAFAGAVELFMNVEHMFSIAIPGENIDFPSPQPFDAWPTITMSTPLLTDRRNVQMKLDYPFTDGVDPEGDVRTKKGDRWIHTADNRVDYSSRMGPIDSNEEGPTCYE